MNLVGHLLGPNDRLSELMTELLDHLPNGGDRLRSEIDREFWDRALLEPALDILGRTGKGFRAQLLDRCWRLAGDGDGDRLPELLPVLIELIHVGSLIIDDIEDDSPNRRGQPTLHRRYGLPIALNTGNWFYFLPLALLPRVDIDDARKLGRYEDISRAMLRCHQGQALDLSIDISTLAKREVPALVLRSTTLKTGSLMELAAVLGARAAGASQERLGAFAQFGTQLGVGLQMLDDWSGIASDKRAEKGVEDLRHRRMTWPWAWLSEESDDITHAEFVKQLRASDTDKEARDLIARFRAELTLTARRRIRAHLDDALNGLASALPATADISPLENDLRELERAYG